MYLFSQNPAPKRLTRSRRSNSSTDGGSKNILRGDIWNGHLQICKNDKSVYKLNYNVQITTKLVSTTYRVF